MVTLRRDQVLRDRGEVVVDDLALRLEAGLVPRRSELAAAADVGQHVDAAALQPQLAEVAVVLRASPTTGSRRRRRGSSGCCRRASCPSGARRSTGSWCRPSTSPRTARRRRARRRTRRQRLDARQRAAVACRRATASSASGNPLTARNARSPCSSASAMLDRRVVGHVQRPRSSSRRRPPACRPTRGRGRCRRRRRRRGRASRSRRRASARGPGA